LLIGEISGRERYDIDKNNTSFSSASDSVDWHHAGMHARTADGYSLRRRAISLISFNYILDLFLWRYHRVLFQNSTKQF